MYAGSEGGRLVSIRLEGGRVRKGGGRWQSSEGWHAGEMVGDVGGEGGGTILSAGVRLCATSPQSGCHTVGGRPVMASLM